MPIKYSIVILAYWHDPRFKKKAGGLIRMYELADNLTRLGHNVTLLVPKIGYPKRLTIAKVIEIPFLDFPLIRPLSFHLLSSITIFINIIKGVNFFYIRQMSSFLPIVIAKILRVPIYFEMPNDPYIAYQARSTLRRFIESNIDKYSMILADRIVALSEWSKDRLHRLGGISDSKMIVLPSGTDPDLFKPLEKEECCNKIGLDPSLIYIGFIGSFLIHQGIETLIDSAPKIVKECPNTNFLLVGDGPMIESWKKKVNSIGLQGSFVFTGQVPYRKVPEYIGAMDICVAPHLKRSNQASPVKLFDYMACGRAIVASDIDIVREITGDIGCAQLVTPERTNDLAVSLISLIKNEKQRKDMGIKGRNYSVLNFDRKKMAEKLCSLYFNLNIYSDES